VFRTRVVVVRKPRESSVLNRGRRHLIQTLVMLLLAGTNLQATGAVPDTPSLAVWILDDQGVVPAGARSVMHDEVNHTWSRYGVDVQSGSADLQVRRVGQVLKACNTWNASAF
jgi:hypothetical protein